MQKHELWAKYGKPVQISASQALEIMGRTAPGLENCAVAFKYPSQEAAQAFAKANLENNGLPSLGIMYSELFASWIGIVDLRKAVEVMERGDA